MVNVYNELIAQLKATGLSSDFSNKIADCLSEDIEHITNEYFQDVLTGRIKKVKKAIQTTLIRAAGQLTKQNKETL